MTLQSDKAVTAGISAEQNSVQAGATVYIPVSVSHKAEEGTTAERGFHAAELKLSYDGDHTVILKQ